ncbi:serine carboxypeptidase family protein [Stylonychia lemnae]|uniref:Carboxypeptidase n=1 Tax=Stylonychia lemnae TaxID=5949 RepID=A0A078A8J2_STYLE|nr:serine carboxypeptidase family protein [Stylonychia lemnae]|eukprot:CDW77106.1 serine carboxypeptidase family protein [Stylonychia lemnae]
MKAIILIATTILLGAQLAQSKLEGKPFINDTFISDYINVDSKDQLFFMLFLSRNNPDKDPLVIWLQGGPGCSSEFGMFTENGPYTVKFDRLKNPSIETTYNNYSWNNFSNVLYLDQPLGTGFSYPTNEFSYRFTERQLSDDFYAFLLGFLEKYPDFNNRPIYLAGESYAGHYIPLFTKRLYEEQNPYINLAGIAIGNGWVDPFYQYPAYNTFALENKLVNKPKSLLIEFGMNLCQFMMLMEFPLVSALMCDASQMIILGNPIYPNFNIYDIREECNFPSMCYGEDGLEFYVQGKKFRSMVNNTKHGQWVGCNSAVHFALTLNNQNNYGVYLKNSLNAGLPVLIYSGDKDFICNWRGGEAWTQALTWDHQDDFNSKHLSDWGQNLKLESNNKTQGGQVKSYENFTFFRIYDAGHMVPTDQPEVAFNMMKEFIAKGKLDSVIDNQANQSLKSSVNSESIMLQ